MLALTPLLRTTRIVTRTLFRRNLSTTSSTNSPSVQPRVVDQPQAQDDDDEIALANAQYAGRVAIHRVDDTVGWGLHVLRDYRQGECVMQARALRTLDTPTSHSIQIDWHRHVEMDLPARLVNHKCHYSANLGVQDNDLGAYDFIALRDITKGESLSWDYLDAEYDMSTPFACACGNAQCRGMVRGWKHAPQDNEPPKDARYLPKYRQTKEPSA